MNRILLAAMALFAVCVPLLLLTTFLRVATSYSALYEYGFKKYDVSAASGISPADLDRVADGLVHYFNSNEDLFTLTITRNGQQVPLFHENEAVHFRDVKGLISFGHLVQWITLGYVMAFAFAVSLWKGRGAKKDLFKAGLWGTGLTIALIAALGIAALVNFDQLFLAFHKTFFNNNLWMAFSGDVMTTLFPEAFFRDALVMIVGAMAFTAILVFVLSWLGLRRAKKD
ncbi:MAG: TIGR01906 family membrane protein [Dehalococcoidia bacterium]|nr:TIGR01906 family membrane protein [Dehalococcoidia bacterium]